MPKVKEFCPSRASGSNDHFYMFNRRDAVFDPESFDPELMTEGLRPKGARRVFL